MPRSGGRLNLIGALNRNVPPNHLSPLDSTDSSSTSNSKHASVCRLERELKAAKEENGRLKEQLEDTRSLLKQLTSEASYEKFDEKRVNMLKLQIIQFQRQILLMSEALGSRSTALMEVENALTWLSGKFRQYIGADVKGAQVPVARSDLMTMVDTSESARIKLFKSVENCSRENFARPQMFMNAFLKPGSEEEFTILDCCLAQPDCLNLKHVAQLESKLSMLYKELIKLSESLAMPARANQDPATGHMIRAVQEREGTILLRASAMARECAAELLSLSLLVPSAPWPPLRKPTMTEVTYDALAPSLPPLPRGKAAEVQRCVTAALKACNHRCHMASQECASLREEVRFHQAVYQLQLDYVLQALDALRNGYKEFEHSTNEVLIQPMKNLMEAYTQLKKNTSQKGLKTFLTVLKEHEDQWTDVIQKLDTSDPQNQCGGEALSAFGQQFLGSLDALLVSRQKERDKAASQKEELKHAQQQLETELRLLIKDGEEQKRIAVELKGGNRDINPDDSTVSSVSGPLENAQQERLTGGRPAQGEPSRKHNASRGKVGKKTQRNLSKNRQPCGSVDDDPEDHASGSTRSRDGHEEREPESEGSAGLRPWLDQPLYTASGEKKPDWNFGLSPRPGSCDSKGQEHQTQKKKEHSQRESRYHFNPASGDLGAQALAPMPNSVHALEEIVRKSAHELENMVRESSSRGSVSTPTDTLQYQSLNSERSLLNYRMDSPLDKGYGDVSRPERTSSGMESDSQSRQQQNHQTFPFSLDTDMGMNCASEKPPCAAGTAAVHASKTGKGRTKPRNYEPKLYVANRTLSLRRSGSLTKLAEPSLEERMMRVSVSGDQNCDSSRTSSRKSSR